MLTFATGLTVNSQSVYRRALTSERQFSVGTVSGATAAFFVVVGVAGLAVARLLTRAPVRLVISGGAVKCVSALLLLGRAQQAWHLFAAYAVFGVGFAPSVCFLRLPSSPAGSTGAARRLGLPEPPRYFDFTATSD